MIWRCSAVFLAAFSAAAMPACALNIEEALAEAARSNPNVRAAREAARAVHEGVPLALSAWLPTVRFNANASGARTGTTLRDTGRTEAGDPVDIGVGTPLLIRPRVPVTETASDGSDRQSLELVYTQNLYRGGRDTAELLRTEENVRQSHASVADTEQTVLLRAATAYLDVRRAQRIIGLREASLASLEARARQTRAQFEVGDRTLADVAQADAEREVAAADLASAKADLEAQQALFEAMVGLPANDLEAAGEPAGLPETLDAALGAARAHRPAVRVALHAERAAAFAVRAAEGDLGPLVDLRAAVTRTLGHGTPGFLNSTDQSLGVRLSVPLYQAGAGRARLSRTRYVLAQRRDQRLAAQREAARRAASAWRNLDAARQRRKAFAVAVKAAGVALAGILREAEIGERTTRDVLDAERSLVLNQVREVTAERDAIVQAYTLLEATGALTAHGLGIQDLPDLEREARETRRNLAPAFMSLD